MSTSRTLTYAFVLLAVAGLAFYLGRISSPGVENGNDPDPTDPGELVLEKATPYTQAIGVDRFTAYKNLVDAAPASSPLNLLSVYDIIQLSELNAIINQLRQSGQDPNMLVIRKGTNPDTSNPEYSTYFYFLNSAGTLLNHNQNFFYNELQRCPYNCYPIFSGDYPAPVGSSQEE